MSGLYSSFFAHLEQRLHAQPQEEGGLPTPLRGMPIDEHDPAFAAIAARIRAPTPAAVLVPIVEREQGLSLILTKRTAKLNDHSGQIAFAGGKVSPEDKSPLHTATREAFEEINLHPSHVSPVGYLDTYISITGYKIVPVVAKINPSITLKAHLDEVDAIFEVPLTFVLDQNNHQLKAKEWYGRERSFYAIEYESWYIWGITAEIIRNLSEHTKDHHALIMG
jgi:8-oxo-dGTP pyrophosphatase MutT (NUDIX family)